MNVIGSLVISTLAGLSTMIGALMIFLNIKTKNYNKFISFCLAFSIAVMIGISIFDLIPASFFQVSNSYGYSKTILLLIIAFVISYIIITFISGILNKDATNEDLYKLGIMNMIVLVLHNLPEGIATFLSSYQDMELGIKLGLAIMIHNIPEGISIAVPIYYSTKSISKAFKATFISGISEPIGAILAFVFLKNYVTDLMISIILIVVAGLMITLSIQEMLPKALKYKENKWVYIGLIFGFLVISINILVGL